MKNAITAPTITIHINASLLLALTNVHRLPSQLFIGVGSDGVIGASGLMSSFETGQRDLNKINIVTSDSRACTTAHTLMAIGMPKDMGS